MQQLQRWMLQESPGSRLAVQFQIAVGKSVLRFGLLQLMQPQRQSLDHLLNHLSTSVAPRDSARSHTKIYVAYPSMMSWSLSCPEAPAPQPVRLLPALPAPGPRAPRTTVMLRNLPNNYTRNMAGSLIPSSGGG